MHGTIASERNPNTTDEFRITVRTSTSGIFNVSEVFDLYYKPSSAIGAVYSSPKGRKLLRLLNIGLVH